MAVADSGASFLSAPQAGPGFSPLWNRRGDWSSITQFDQTESLPFLFDRNNRLRRFAGLVCHQFKIPASQARFACYHGAMNATWPLQDAKNKLSELVDTALRDGAQTITRHGKPVVVVLSADAYARLQPSEKLVDILQDCPVKDWPIERDLTPARDLDFQ